MTVRILTGDCLRTLKTLPAASVNTCVTSPPYWGLRDYGHAGQLGLEPTPEAYVAKMVKVFAGVKRVLRDDGTLWLNLGDSYASKPNGPSMAKSKLQGSMAPHAQSRLAHGRRSRGLPAGLKHKDLIGIPWMVAHALRTNGAASPAHMADIERWIAAVTASYDGPSEWPAPIRREVRRLEREHAQANKGGWYLRSDIIWSKSNPMPESVTDRPTKAHEYIFLLSKRPTYYYDNDAIQERAVYADPRMDDPAFEPDRLQRDFPGMPSRGGGPLKKSGGGRTC